MINDMVVKFLFFEIRNPKSEIRNKKYEIRRVPAVHGYDDNRRQRTWHRLVLYEFRELVP